MTGLWRGRVALMARPGQERAHHLVHADQLGGEGGNEEDHQDELELDGVAR